MGGRDPHVAGLLQPPLDYPSIDDHASDVLNVEGTRRARRRPARRTRIAQADGGTSGRTLTPEQEVTLETLDQVIVLGPMYGDMAANTTNPIMVPSGEPFVLAAELKWKNPQGSVVPWDDSRILVRYGRNDPIKNAANLREGRGPHAFRPTFGDSSAAVEVELWNEGRKKWEWHLIFAQGVKAYCSVDMTGLSEDEQNVVATLFAEGGSMVAVTRDELIRVAWAMRNRVEVIKAYEDATLTNPADSKVKSRLKTVRGFGKQATYTSVLSHRRQFGGFGNENFKLAMEPASKIKDGVACARLQLCWDVGLDVMLGIEPDPYAGQGNSTASGVFYYMTKEAYAENVAWNLKHDKRDDQKFAPEWDGSVWPRLPSQPGDHHLFWGMRPRDPFDP